MENINWNEKVKEALDRTEFMAISTSGPDGCWVNPVAFAYSENLKLFWISMLDAKHSQNIISNPQVSVAIFHTERFSTGDVLGLQLTGVARQLTSPEEIEKAAECYFGRNDANSEFKNETSENGLSAKWQFFTVEPTEVWCFDSREFGEKRIKVEIGELNLMNS